MIEAVSNFGPVQGLVFDMGDVLYDATVWRRWLLQLLHRMGLHTQYRAFYKVWDCDFLDDVHCGRREYGEAFQAFLLSSGLSRGQIDEVEAASQARKRTLEGNTRPFPGVRGTLERLHNAGMLLAVLSDSESRAEDLRSRMARLGIGRYFSATVSSIDLERTKPDPACYLAALGELGLTAAQAAFVGHDIEELDGARAVGMRTLAFNYETGVTADRYLSRFEDLTQLIDRRVVRHPASAGAL